MSQQTFGIVLFMAIFASFGAHGDLYRNSEATGQLDEASGDPVAGAQAPAAEGAKNRQEPTAAANAGGGGGSECAGVFNKSTEICTSYLESDPPSPRNPGKLSGNTPADIDRINQELRNAVHRSHLEARRCTTAAYNCSKACAKEYTKAQTCASLSRRAKDKDTQFKKAAKDSGEKLDGTRDSLVGRANPEPTEGTKTPSSGDSGGANSTPATSPQSASPQSVASRERPVEKTREQIKEERREKRAEARRQERIEALSKAFMSLNQQQPLNQALQEKDTSTPAQQQMAAATAAQQVAGATVPSTTAKANPVPGESKNENEDENARAGFNALAKKNLQARRALAVAMGLPANHLPGATSLRPMASAGGTTSAGIGPSADGGQFGFTGEGASLDPVVETQRPSDLPQNFRLGAPSAGGGGGSATQSLRVPTNKRAAKPYAGRTEEDDTPARGPAGLEPASAEIRTQSADIWMVMSSAFHRRCAQGRLMDCADHLPK